MLCSCAGTDAESADPGEHPRDPARRRRTGQGRGVRDHPSPADPASTRWRPKGCCSGTPTRCRSARRPARRCSPAGTPAATGSGTCGGRRSGRLPRRRRRTTGDVPPEPRTPYTTALAGKWHLGATGDAEPSHPATSGSTRGPARSTTSRSRRPTGTVPQLHPLGEEHRRDLAYSDTYAILDTTDDAIAGRAGCPSRGSCWLHTTPPTPLHDPPAELHPWTPIAGTPNRRPDGRDGRVARHRDGRLLDKIDAEVRGPPRSW